MLIDDRLSGLENILRVFSQKLQSQESTSRKKRHSKENKVSSVGKTRDLETGRHKQRLQAFWDQFRNTIPGKSL